MLEKRKQKRQACEQKGFELLTIPYICQVQPSFCYTAKAMWHLES
jgi:hypothetical protein